MCVCVCETDGSEDRQLRYISLAFTLPLVPYIYFILCLLYSGGWDPTPHSSLFHFGMFLILPEIIIFLLLSLRLYVCVSQKIRVHTRAVHHSIWFTSLWFDSVWFIWTYKQSASESQLYSRIKSLSTNAVNYTITRYITLLKSFINKYLNCT